MELITEYPEYYTAADIPELVNIETAHYVSLLGNGSPGTKKFYEKKTAIKDFVAAMQKQFEGTDKEFRGSVIEIFYWYDEKDGFVNIASFYTTLSLDLLHYRIAIRIPEYITAEDIEAVAVQKSNIAFTNEYERFTYTAGQCVQLMHSGPFADELERLPVLQKFATDNGFMNRGIHHEIHITPFEKGESQQ